MSSQRVAQFLVQFTDWARARPDILGLALVGSHARGSATETSDVDLIIIAKCPDDYLEQLDWIRAFGQVERWQLEEYGKLISVRAWYGTGLEIEYGMTDESWAELPLDVGTREVIAGGMLVLFERGDMLSRHQAAQQPQKPMKDQH